MKRADLDPVHQAHFAWTRDLSHAGQRPPADPWRTWVFLGGRGAGKTRAGAEWLDRVARKVGRVALVGPTLHDVREVMIGGPSGLCSLPSREPPRYAPSRRRLEWDNGAHAYAFSAEDPDSLRGPQFAAAWADEFCAWPRGESVLANLRLGLRLGTDPRLVVTTTPKPIPAFRKLLAEASTVSSHAPTAENAANLAPEFLGALETLYGGTRLAAQELEGRLVDAEGTLWRAADLVAARVSGPPPRFERVVVAVDPPATQHGAACGIVVAGRSAGTAYILADRTVRGLTPAGWAGRVAAAVEDWGATCVVAETNQGGDMVKSVLRGAGIDVPIRSAFAQFGKVARAEPVALFYEQARVKHCGAFAQLEEELLAMGADDPGRLSPDRADALVWAVTDLLITSPLRQGPRITQL